MMTVIGFHADQVDIVFLFCAPVTGWKYEGHFGGRRQNRYHNSPFITAPSKITIDNARSTYMHNKGTQSLQTNLMCLLYRHQCTSLQCGGGEDKIVLKRANASVPPDTTQP